MSALDIHLPLFSVTVTSDTATIYGQDYTALTGDATVDVDVSTTLMQNLFQFQSDSVDINDISASDLKYKVVYSTANPNFPNFPTSLDFDPLGLDFDTSSNVTVDAIASNYGLNYNLTYDYVRFLAQSLFGTHLGVDLFNNEAAVRSYLNLVIKHNLDYALASAAGYEFPTDWGSPPADTTVMRQILLQIIESRPERFIDISSNYTVGVDPISGETWYKIPFLAGDKVYFTIRVQPSATQSSSTTGATVNDRVYLVRATLV